MPMSTHLRPDFATIANWIRPGSRVLDLGCGDGSLLHHLQHTRQVQGYGIEIDDAKIRACFERGVSVLQYDLEAGLSQFSDQAFDYVVLSLTLQATHHTQAIVRDMLRVGRQGIVSFPNFGYWRNRWQQLVQGRMPVSDTLPYQWHDTPNVHLCTLRDFEAFCHDNSWKIHERCITHQGHEVPLLPNLLGSLALFRISAA
jgi:methionine biosynthesis protein MetW